jgi:hypothetical protein
MSADLASWQSAVAGQTAIVVSEDAGLQLIEVRFPLAGDGSRFLRIEASASAISN